MRESQRGVRSCRPGGGGRLRVKSLRRQTGVGTVRNLGEERMKCAQLRIQQILLGGGGVRGGFLQEGASELQGRGGWRGHSSRHVGTWARRQE